LDAPKEEGWASGARVALRFPRINHQSDDVTDNESNESTQTDQLSLVETGRGG